MKNLFTILNLLNKDYTQPSPQLFLVETHRTTVVNVCVQIWDESISRDELPIHPRSRSEVFYDSSTEVTAI